jgi:hypothetical protein
VHFTENKSVHLDDDMIRERWAVDDEGEMYLFDVETLTEN